VARDQRTVALDRSERGAVPETRHPRMASIPLDRFPMGLPLRGGRTPRIGDSPSARPPPQVELPTLRPAGDVDGGFHHPGARVRDRGARGALPTAGTRGAMSTRPGIVHSNAYFAEIGLHVFPMRKFQLTREEIVRRGLLRDEEIVVPKRASMDQVLRVHDRAYVDKMVSGNLSVLEEMVLELPYSESLVEASFLCAGGSIEAARLALEQKIGINLAGGFHHAFPDHGEGFCVFNDIAIAIRDLQHEKRIRR